MLFTSELLNKLESNEELKKTYAGQGSLGKNKLIALPVIIAFIAAFIAYFCYDLSKTDPGYTSYWQISTAIIIICIIAAVIIQAKAKKEISGNFEGVKVCLAKKM